MMKFTITISKTYNQMNLQENINRIKEVMGINEASMNPYLLRRIPEFIRAVEDVADAIYVRSDRDFSESEFRNFLDRAIFGSIRDVIEYYDLTNDELGKLEIILSRIIYGDKNLLQRLKQIYISKLDLESLNEEEVPISIKRRFPELINSVLESASYYNPNMYLTSFDVFMERSIYAGIVTQIPDEDFDRDLVDYLEDMMKSIILNDPVLLKKMKSIYEKRSRLKKKGINESSTDPYLKRRFPELVQAVFEAAKWYVPSFMPDFETYVDRAIYSGIISVLSDTYADSNVDKMYELEDILRDTIYGNEDLLKKMKDLYNQV